MKINDHQVGWLRRIAATPKGVLTLYGTQQMNPRARDILHEAGMLRWMQVPGVGGAPGSIVYVITEGGRAALETRPSPPPELPPSTEALKEADSMNGLL